MNALIHWPYFAQTLTVFVVTIVAMISPAQRYVKLAISHTQR